MSILAFMIIICIYIHAHRRQIIHKKHNKPIILIRVTDPCSTVQSHPARIYRTIILLQLHRCVIKSTLVYQSQLSSNQTLKVLWKVKYLYRVPIEPLYIIVTEVTHYRKYH